jgi:DNA-directed RNA polymerase specialized sigma24 family protein
MIDDIIEKDIRIKARKYHINGMDIEDVEQELRILCWQKEKEWDKNRAGLRTFLNGCMRNYLTDLSKKARRQKRYPTLYLDDLKDVKDEKYGKMTTYFSDDFKNKYL